MAQEGTFGMDREWSRLLRMSGWDGDRWYEATYMDSLAGLYLYMSEAES